MLKNLARREFIKTAAMGLLAFNAFGVLPDEKLSPRGMHRDLITVRKKGLVLRLCGGR